MLYFEYSGLQIYYEKKGEGIPIIFLHGWGCNKEIFSQIITNLTNKYEVYLIDLPSFGKSINTTIDFTIKELAHMLLSFIEYYNIDYPILVGHSYGGRILLEYASKYYNYSKLILIDSAGIKRYSLKKQFKIYLYKLKKKYFKLTKQLMKYEKLVSSSGSIDYKNSSEVQKKMLTHAVNYDQKHLLKDITKETLLIWGEHDTKTPLKDAKLMHKQIKNSGLVIIPNCGHFPFIENHEYFMSAFNNYLGV